MNTAESTNRVFELAFIISKYRSWYARERSQAKLHPFVIRALDAGHVPADWHQLTLEYPHIPDDGARAKVAYTRDERSGEADRQTVTTLGKYLTRHFPGMPDHKIRDLVALAAPESCKLVHTMAEMLFHLLRGPGSCMAKEWRNPEEHPYNVYNPARGWHMAVRVDADDTVGRALCMDDGEAKFFVRSYKKGDGYSYTDETLEAWLKDQGYEKRDDWEGCTLDFIGTGWSDDFIAPYLDGSVQTVDIKYSSGERYLCITPYGEYECNNTDGTVSTGEICEDCEGRFDEGDGYWVGRHEDRQVCERCCDNNYRMAYGRRGSRYYAHESEVIYIDSQDEYYDLDYLEDNEIVELANGDYEHQSEAWQCADSGDWYSNDEDYIEIDGRTYHPDSDTAKEYLEEQSEEA